MKVGFVAPLGIAAVNGGVRTQALQTAKALQNLGVDVEFISPWQDTIEVDLIHIFVAGPDTLGILKRCSELGIRTVLSPVFFSNRSSSTIKTALKFEQFLSFLGSGIRSDFGIKAEACRIADLILPNTTEEAQLIIDGFNVDPRKILVIPNGVENRFKDADPKLFMDTYGIKDFVLFVGEAGAPRKNVIKLLEAATRIEAQIVIIGSFYDDEYGRKCRELSQKADNVLLIETLEHDSKLLESAYSACHSFVLPSFYETPGIAAMEAGLAGANVVITERGGTKDYFKDMAEYIIPEDVSSIINTINNSLLKKKSTELKNEIAKNFTWDKIGEKTKNTYKKYFQLKS